MAPKNYPSGSGMRFALVFTMLLFLAACGGGSSDTSGGSGDPQAAYQRAVADAIVAEPAEIVTSLTPIVGYNTDLIWEGAPGASRVLMVSWVDGDYYDDSVGQEYTLPGWLQLWVTAVPEIQAFFAPRPSSSEAILKPRVEQLLGMPPDTANTKFVEVWVNPNDLVRPCPDPEITDTVCELDFPPPRFQELSSEYRQWFESNRASSYGGSNPYPWTRLGYTCDWYRGQGCDTGLSEFVIWPGSTVGVRSVRTTVDYLNSVPE
jgi:hypothetical protein